MQDSLKAQGELMAGIPDEGTRLTMLICCGFVIAVFILLAYLRMQEADNQQ